MFFTIQDSAFPWHRRQASGNTLLQLAATWKSLCNAPASSWPHQEHDLILTAQLNRQETMINTRNFLYNTALIFGIAVAGPSFADDATAVDPSTMTQQEREAYRAERQAGMTPEQRAEKQASRSQGGSPHRQGTMA